MLHSFLNTRLESFSAACSLTIDWFIFTKPNGDSCVYLWIISCQTNVQAPGAAQRPRQTSFPPKRILNCLLVLELMTPAQTLGWPQTAIWPLTSQLFCCLSWINGDTGRLVGWANGLLCVCNSIFRLEWLLEHQTFSLSPAQWLGPQTLEHLPAAGLFCFYLWEWSIIFSFMSFILLKGWKIWEVFLSRPTVKYNSCKF